MTQTLLKLAAKLFGSTPAWAHCDIPCGIYDPHRAQIATLTIIRMNQLAEQMGESDHAVHDLMRLTAVKEEHAEILKQEIRIIWGDFFKIGHAAKHPELHDLTHKIMQTASHARQSFDLAVAEQLLELVNQFAEIFWQVKEVPTKKAICPYEPKKEVIYPAL
ncbi:MAG: superoxide dismutase, Ni [Candidatus Doudnabacteria bacterium]